MEFEHSSQLFKYDDESYFVIQESPAFFSNGKFSDYLADDSVCWLNFHSIEDRESIDHFCEFIKIDKLTIEDIYTEKRRPKLEEYNDYLFFSIRSALPTSFEDKGLNQEQISFVLGKHFLVSFQQKSSDHFIDVRDRIIRKRGKIRTKNADFLLFRLLDAIIDNYFEVIEDIADRILQLEKEIATKVSSDVLKNVEIQKRKLVELKKIVMPLKEMTFQLEKTQHYLIDKTNKHHFADLKENCLMILEEIDANKQILDGISNIYYAIQGQRMNEIMRVLTVISSIFIPLTFIVGVYGMNFENMPELKYKYGYYIIVAIMFVIALSLLGYFIKRGWLKRRKF